MKIYGIVLCTRFEKRITYSIMYGAQLYENAVIEYLLTTEEVNFPADY